MQSLRLRLNELRVLIRSKGYAPTKSDDEQALEELQKAQTSLEAQIEQLKDQLLTATLIDDTEQLESIKAQYQTLVGGE